MYINYLSINYMSDKEIFQRAYKKAINGGLSGFGAMTFQVCSLMVANCSKLSI